MGSYQRVSIQDKLKIITERKNNTVSVIDQCEQYKVSPQAIHYIVKHMTKIIAQHYRTLIKEQQILHSYAIGNCSVSHIAKKYKTSKGNVTKILQQNNVQKRSVQSLQEKIIYDYETQELSAPQISKIYGIGTTSVYRTLQRSGIPRKTLSEANRKYDMSFKEFEMRPTSRAWYCLGMIMADGNIHISPNNVPIIDITLQESDYPHLEKIKQVFHTQRPLHYKRKQKAFSLRFNATKYGALLNSYGIYPCKSSHNCEAMNGAQNNRHFWRGVIDGDGSLFIKQTGKEYKGKKYYTPIINLCGSHALCQQLKSYAHQRVAIRSKAKVSKHGNIFRIAFSGKNAYHVIKHLYQNHTISMDRKQKMADHILSAYKEKYE